ncbi:hypothetical protein L198_08256 [Cryptococcus wingfieldii CBS 7118]|uniref:Zn(2)-C6 fungal-type domain-containing protein n=1 Tax=Cryptococcus wingfieldii CBS 7118 TaxID=1295528 RepID=A0A1E3HDM8_9TREE|nr:hypothetical protein L198_08256 [Cryptococcus wingfieldii CBS 7118]ODN74235.1 hypothetical protein L198_08256 [Cryptococcus wingfieldii CBS 7118]
MGDRALSLLFSFLPCPSPVSETINTAVGDENKESASSPLFSPPPPPSPSLPPIAPFPAITAKPASEKVYLGLRLFGIRGPTVPSPVVSAQPKKPSDKVRLGLLMPGIRTPALLPNAQPEKTCDKSKPKARSSAHTTTTNIFKATRIRAWRRRGMLRLASSARTSALASLFTSPAEGAMNDVIDLTLIDSPPSSPSPVAATYTNTTSDDSGIVCLSTPVNTSSVVGQRDSSSDRPKAKARSSAHANMSNTIKASGSQSPSGDKKTHAKGCKHKSNSCEYCKRRQIKCDRDEFKACTACFKKGIECVYNIVPGKRGALKASQEGAAMGRTLSGSVINCGLPSTPRLSSSPSSNASVAILTPPRAASLYAQLASTSSANCNIVAAPSAPFCPRQLLLALLPLPSFPLLLLLVRSHYKFESVYGS